MLSLRSLALLVLASTLPGTAQDEPVKTEFLTVALGGTVKELFYRSHGEVSRLQAFETGIGAPVEYLGPQTVAFYKSAQDLEPRPEGEPPPKPVAIASLPKADRALLVFAFPDRKPGTPPRLRAFGISTKTLREGDYRLFNFSKGKVFAILGDKKSTVAPGRQADLSTPAWKKEVLDLPVKFGLESGGKVREVYSSVWGHRPQRRMFLFFFDQADPNRPLDVRKYYDVPSVKAPPAPSR